MVINGYDINSEIYRGPVTTVYDANHLALGRHVILKVLNTQWMEEKDLIERFRREAKICAMLDHPNIVKIFDFSISKESIFISMEFIEGSTLESLIQQNKIINFSELINIASQILTGLSYAHKQGITHRDIKPSNIMISPDGHVKITDFGLAVVADLPSVTGQDQTVGSPAYMSPEQALGKNLDQRSDLFSLGVSLYRACAQFPPFETDNIGTTIQNILTKEVETLSSIDTETPLWFSNLIDALLAKNRENRPESAETVLNSINSNFTTNEIGQYKGHLKTSQPVIVSTSRIPILNNLNSKIQKRIFAWAFPIIIILAYLIFRQSDYSWSEQTAQRNNLAQIQHPIIPDSSILSQSDKNVGDENTTEKSNNRLVNVSPISLDRTSRKIDNLSETNSSTSRLEKSHVYIIARPWADIYVDSIYFEATPLSKPISLDPGSHFIELRNPNYQTFYQYLEIMPAQSETLIVEMKLNVGFLNIRVLPWAKIYIDGEYRETSPIENPITLAAGEHILTLTNPNYDSIKDTINVYSGKTVDKNFKLAK
jgi:serine/threonine-protein kinase